MNVQERTVMREAEQETKRNRKKVLGIFPRRDKGSGTASGSTTPHPDTRSSIDKSSHQSVESDDDDLPPREGADIGLSPTMAMSRDSFVTKDDEQVRAIPKTAGFDFKAISRELGKDINVDSIKQPTPRAVEAIPLTTPLDRSGSAPPVRVQVIPPAEEQGRSPMMMRSVSYADAVKDAGVQEEEDDGDIAASASRQLQVADLPSWGQASNSPKPSPPLSASFRTPTFAGFNAWSASSNPSFPPRAAPPARPHPPELMANPFANGSASNGILGGWGKTEKEMAEKNPW